MAFWFGRFGVSSSIDVLEDFFCRKENFPRKKRPNSKEGTTFLTWKWDGSWNILDSLKTAQKAYFQGRLLLVIREGSKPLKYTNMASYFRLLESKGLFFI